MDRHVWQGWLQFNGEECSIFAQLEFPVPEAMYRQIREAVDAGKRLTACAFYPELEEMLIDSFNTDRYEDDSDRPQPEDYDEDEYQEALEAYEADHQTFYDRFGLMEAAVYDPAEEREFRARFKGRRSPVLAASSENTYSFEMLDDADRAAETHLMVEHDANGVITDIRDIRTESLECESVKSSSWSNAHPHYDDLAAALEKELKIEG